MSLSEEPVLVEGGNLWTWRSGAGGPLILCHGGPGLWDYTKPIADLIEDVAEVVRFDQRGCGRSTCGPPFTLDGAVADLDAVRDHFRMDSAIFAGHSWGATLCLAYALRHPSRVRSIIYLSGVGSDPTWSDRFRNRRDELLTASERQRLQELWSRLMDLAPDDQGPTLREYANLAWPIDFADRSFGRTKVSSILRDGAFVNLAATPLATEANARLTGDALESQLPSLRCPVLVVHGLSDPRPFDSAQRLAATLPDGKFIGLKGVGHHAMLEAPFHLQEQLRPFIRETTAHSPVPSRS
jgi:proline iminopeptidase